VLFVFCTLKIAVFTEQKTFRICNVTIKDFTAPEANWFIYKSFFTLHDKSDFSKNSHSTETNFNYSTNFESAKNVRSLNVVEFEFELRHIPSGFMKVTVAYSHGHELLTVHSAG